MSLINILNIIVDNNPTKFQDPFVFRITFECVKPIEQEIEWKLIYVGSAKDECYDQVLDSFCMDSLQAGVMQFQLESAGPNYQLIPSKDDLFGVTAIIITISYAKKEFFRCGYYVYNNYVEKELLENDPPQVLIERIQRSILAEKPRITRYDIDWGSNDEAEKKLYLGEQGVNKQTVLNDTTNFMNEPNYGSEMRKYMVDGKIGFIDNNSYNPFTSSNGIFNELNNVPNECYGGSGNGIWNGVMSNNSRFF